MKKILSYVPILFISNCVIAFSQYAITPGCSFEPPQKINNGSFDPKYKLPGIPDLATCGSNDAFISKVGGVPGSSDSSDHVSIVDSPAIQFTLLDGTHVTAEDIGSIAAGQTLPVHLKATIKNIGTVDLLLDSAVFIGTNKAEFSLVSSLEGIVLKEDSTITVELNFTPGDVGTRTADLIVFGSCNTIASITITGTGLPPCLANPEEFVVFCQNSIGDTTRTEITLKFQGMGITGKLISSDSAFSIKIIETEYSPNNGYSYGYVKYLISYHPHTSGSHSGEIIFHVMPCGDSVITSLKGGLISSVAENPLEQILLTPNPASDFIKIIFPTENLLKAELYNVVGESVLKLNPDFFNQQSLTFSTTEIPSGIYYLHFFTKDNFIVKKVIINH